MPETLRWWQCLGIYVLVSSGLGSGQRSNGVRAQSRQEQDYSRVDSEWGSWQGWSGCSRSCGGGISKRTRSCRRPIEGSRYFHILEHFDCVGLYEEYQSCNLQDCPEGSRDFREVQCSAYDNEPFMGKLYTWEPFLEAPKSCELNCRARGQKFYVKHADQVVDGTPCTSEDYAKICINGQCKLQRV